MFLNASGEPCRAFTSGEKMTIRVAARFTQAVDQPVVGLLIRNRLGIDVFGTNTRVEQVDLGSYEPGTMLSIEFTLDCNLSRQDYTLTVATQHVSGLSQDWLDDALQFTVIEPKEIAGLLNLRPSIRWRKATGEHPEYADHR